MTLNYRGSKYEFGSVTSVDTTSRKGIYRGAVVDFAKIRAKSSSGRTMTYRGSAYTAA